MELDAHTHDACISGFEKLEWRQANGKMLSDICNFDIRIILYKCYKWACNMFFADSHKCKFSILISGGAEEVMCTLLE